MKDQTYYRFMPETEILKTNIPEFSVSELAFSLKKTLEENYGRVRIRGEIGRVTIAGSGHLYTNLKDDSASIDAVCWKGAVSKLSVRPEEGLEVICTGRVSSYPASSKYQLIIESMELAGQGALLKMLEERRKKLAAEGLFDDTRKKKLPFLPDVIGVVTSPTGAVIRDILHRLEDRFPRHVLIWPVLVQGEAAAGQIAAAIEGFQTIGEKGLPKPDLLIVARGGGSLEDLMPFNEEIVVRAAAASKIPLISAVGHETDTTLIDFAADLRAPTPTGAAEMAVPRRSDLLARTLENEQRLFGGINRQLSELRHKLDAQGARLGDPAKLLENRAQKLDHIGDKMTRSFRELIAGKSRNIIEFGARLRHPQDRVAQEKKMLERWSEQLLKAGTKLVENKGEKLRHLDKMLEAYSFENVLERGFAVIYDSAGTILTDAGQARAAQAIKIRFRGKEFVDAATGDIEKEKRTRKKSDKKPGNGQQSLF
jgi:exodeoxyribonuclease VII large subunit